MAQKSIQVRIDEKLKKRAESIFAAVGLDTPTAIRVFFMRVVADGGIPFMLSKMKEEGYSKAQWKSIDEAYEESLHPENLSPVFTSADDLIAALRK